MPKPTILLISGSLKKDSSNNKLLELIAENNGVEANFKFATSLDLLPHFNLDLDNQTPPEIIQKFRKEVTESDAVLICSPEYVFSMPAVLKNALEWCVSTEVFTNKPVAVIVAAASGHKAMEQLVLVLGTIQCKLSLETQLVISGVKGKMNPSINEGAKIDFDVFMRSFHELIGLK